MDDKYQVMPPLTDEEYQQLKNDIAENGVLVPIEFDTNGNCLDGHHRLQICEELNIKDYPKVVRVGIDSDKADELAVTLNLVRRQLSRDQKIEVATTLKTRHPEWPIAKIAKLVGMQEGDLAEQFNKNGQCLQLETLPTVERSNGRKYPTPEYAQQQREEIRQTISDHPNWSDRKVAGEVGASHHTVAKQREVVNEIKATFSPTQAESQPEPKFEPEPKRYEYSVDLGNVERDLRNSIEALDASLKYIVNPDNKMFGSAEFNQVIAEQLNNCEDIVNKYRRILNKDA